MSDFEEQTEDNTTKKKKSPLGLILLAFAIVAVFLGIGISKNANNKAAENSDLATAEPFVEEYETISQNDPLQPMRDSEPQNSEEALNSEEVVEIVEVVDETKPIEPATSVTLNIESLSTPRILGNPEAPMKISEHSSFTCPACALFHKDNFKNIKEQYIDTGKAYIVFDDFPRNSYDVTIGAIARCVPEQAYFNFIQLVFESQKEWLSDKNFMSYMKQNAKLAGANEETINACIESKELHEALAQRQYDAGEKHNVKSTPTLIINDNVSISGLSPYEKIVETLDSQYKKLAQ